MDVRKRPRIDHKTPNDDDTPSPTVALLQTQLNTLRTQLTHAQSMRSLERKSYNLNEERLKRQIADAHLEMEQQREINDAMKHEMDQMEDQMNHWVERAREAEENEAVNAGSGDDEAVAELERNKCNLLQQKLDAVMIQVGELTTALQESQERAATAELKASDVELKLSQLQFDKEEAARNANVSDENCNPQILRATRVQLAESERCARELTRQNNEMKTRLKDMLQVKEKEGLSQRKISQLEKEVQQLQQRVESGQEVETRWMGIRRELLEEGLVEHDDVMDSSDFSVSTAGIPPEIATVVRKVRGLKSNVAKLHEENARLSAVSDERSKRCALFDKELKERNECIFSLEKQLKAANENISRLEVENKKIVAQQVIWKRESEGMRSLLNTYEMQETNAVKSIHSPKLKSKSQEEMSPIVKGLQLSLKSAQEEVKLLTETNQRLESEINGLKSQQKESAVEHERVLEKFGKLRSALMEERSKAQAAEERACKAETLAGKGSYNVDTTRVLHLESNPLSEAIREKYQTEINMLKQRLEHAEQLAAESQGATGSSPSSRSKGSFGTGRISDGLSSLDAQKLHKRLKERFKEQIGLFREGVYLLTGFKIDMSFTDSDCPHFKVRSMYNEREEDHLMFQWRRKKDGEDNDLDLMSTDLAQLLMNGPSAIYMTKFCSVPAFLASVTLGLFEKQTMI